jgi:hypothetical protein
MDEHESKALGDSGSVQDLGQPGEIVRRFDRQKTIKSAKKTGVRFDAQRGQGIPTTSTELEPINPGKIRDLTGARNADHYMDIAIDGKKVIRRTTKAGHKEIVVQEDILPTDIVGYGKTRISSQSPED